MKWPALALVALLLVGMVQAAEVKDPSTAADFVNGSGSSFSFAVGPAASQGATWVITAPDGRSATVSRTGGGAESADDVPEVQFTLDGVQVSESAQWTWVGDLTGAPADGTWTVQVEGDYSSNDGIPAETSQPSALLFVNDRGIRFGVGPPITPLTRVQAWNRHITSPGTTWVEPSTSGTITAATVDAPNEAGDEDPLNARYYQPLSGSQPGAATGQFTLSCPASMTVNGAWARGATQAVNTFARFASVPGLEPGATDLRVLPGVTFTTLTDKGSGATGTHSASVAYNNAAGTTYQFMARAGATGTDVLGAVVAVPPLQCTITNPTIALAELHDENDFDLTVSQAQCAGDAVSFSMDIQIGSALVTIADLDVYVQDAATGTTVLQVDDADMLAIGTRVEYFSREFQAGAYSAIAKIDLAGLGTVDLYDSAAFNVPLEDCGPTDLTPVLAVLNQHDANQTLFHDNLTAYLDHINAHLHQIDANLTATRGDILDAIESLNMTIELVFECTTGNETGCNLLIEIYNIIIEKFGPPGEPVQVEYPQLSLLLLLAAFIFAGYRLIKRPWIWMWVFAILALGFFWYVFNPDDASLAAVVAFLGGLWVIIMLLNRFGFGNKTGNELP